MTLLITALLFVASRTDLISLLLSCNHKTSCCVLSKLRSIPVAAALVNGTGHCSSMDRHQASAKPKLYHRCFAYYMDAQDTLRDKACPARTGLVIS